MKDLTENLETASEASDYQEAPIEPKADPDAGTLMPPTDPSVAAKP